MLITKMPDLGNLVGMSSSSSLTLIRCPNNNDALSPLVSTGNIEPTPAKESENQQDETGGIKKSVESKSLNDYVNDWKTKHAQLGVPESKLFLPFLVCAPKLV